MAEYEKNLTHLIRDVRKEFEVPELPAVIATVGFGGSRMNEKFLRIHEAQMAVGDPAKHPEFKGNVISVDTRGFWQEVEESPKSEDYHYHRNAGTYLSIGEAIGRAMVGLQGGTAEPLPLPAAAPAKPQDTAPLDGVAAKAAVAPIIIDGIARAYIADPRNNPALVTEANSERPQRPNQFLNGAMFGLTQIYRAAEIDDYDWRPFGPDLRKAEWDYFSFDPPETQPKEKGGRYREVTYPAGMENWTAPDFDPVRAGWKKGLPAFGQLDGKLAPLTETCTASFCGCGEAPKSLWEKEVLLIRGTFEMPPIKEGHRYRLVVGGSAHVNSGEGYAIYINGKLLDESKSGVPNRQGGQPRGAPVYVDFRDEFKGGKVTLAATSFLSYRHRNSVSPPRGHFSLWMEEQKIPPVETLSGNP